MNEFAALVCAPILPIASATAVGLALGLRWRRRALRPGPGDAARCTLLAVFVGYLAFLAHGETLVRPWLFLGLLLATALAASLLAFAIATRSDQRSAWRAAGAGLVLAALPFLAFVMPNALHLVLYWNPGYWLALGFIRAHADDATLLELGLHFPASFDGPWVVGPIALCSGVAGWLVRRRRAAI